MWTRRRPLRRPPDQLDFYLEQRPLPAAEGPGRRGVLLGTGSGTAGPWSKVRTDGSSSTRWLKPGAPHHDDHRLAPGPHLRQQHRHARQRLLRRLVGQDLFVGAGVPEGVTFNDPRFTPPTANRRRRRLPSCTRCRSSGETASPAWAAARLLAPIGPFGGLVRRGAAGGAGAARVARDDAPWRRGRRAPRDLFRAAHG